MPIYNFRSGQRGGKGRKGRQRPKLTLGSNVRHTLATNPLHGCGGKYFSSQSVSQSVSASPNGTSMMILYRKGEMGGRLVVMYA